MTDDELDRLEELWLEGVKVSDIADKLGYSKSLVEKQVHRDRRRFPYRHNRINRRLLDMVVDMVMNGKVTVRNAAYSLGVCEDVIRRELRCRSHRG